MRRTPNGKSASPYKRRSVNGLIAQSVVPYEFGLSGSRLGSRKADARARVVRIFRVDARACVRRRVAEIISVVAPEIAVEKIHRRDDSNFVFVVRRRVEAQTILHHRHVARGLGVERHGMDVEPLRAVLRARAKSEIAARVTLHRLARIVLGPRLVRRVRARREEQRADPHGQRELHFSLVGFKKAFSSIVAM